MTPLHFFLTLPQIDSDIGSDAEDFSFKATDLVLVSANTDNDYSCLEVHVYDTETGSLFVHHDISLPAFPLCVARMGIGHAVLGDNTHTQSENYIAVGTFEPVIELWNLNVVDCLEPNLSLGKGTRTGHSDAVMGLDWNPLVPSLLASCSADKTVKIWDLGSGDCGQTLTTHGDKVQEVAWHPSQHAWLLSGGFDRKIIVNDVRVGSASTVWKTEADVESVMWRDDNACWVSTEDGKVQCFDVRKPKKRLWEVQAHSEECSSVCVNGLGLMATCSADKSVKLWDARGETPSLLYSRDMNAGRLFTLGFSEEDPFLLATGGNGGSLCLWHTDKQIGNAFGLDVEQEEEEEGMEEVEEFEEDQNDMESDEVEEEEGDGMEMEVKESATSSKKKKTTKKKKKKRKH